MIRLLRRRRLQLTAAVTVFLVLAGGSGATAYWSGQAQLQAQAGTARMGIEFKVVPTTASSPLAVSYTAQSRVAAGAVTITNTGTRAATHELSIAAESPSNQQLPASISVSVASVLVATDCTPQRTFAAPTVRTLSTETTSFPISGSVPAGATAILCVQTTLAATAASPTAAQSLQLAIGAELTYASAAGWSTSAPISRIPQAVAAIAAGPVIYDYARYTIRNDGGCVSRVDGVSRTAACADDSSQWRITSAGDGKFHILAANPWGDPSGRWTAGADNVVSNAATTTGGTTQQWTITGPVSGPFQIKSVSTGLCATVAATNARRVELTVCNGSASQAFALELASAPLPSTPQQAACRGDSGGYYLQLTFARSAGYENQTQYRVFLSRESSLGERTPFPPQMNGYTAQVDINNSNQNLVSFAGPNWAGNTRVTVQQSIAGSAWTTAAIGDVRTERVGTELRVRCGWQ